MCESCGAEYRSIFRLTLAPISAMSARFCSPATATAHVSIASSAALKLWMETTASLAITAMNPSCRKVCFEKAQAMFASSGGAVLPGVAAMFVLIFSAMMVKRFWSWNRRFAKAQARRARSSVLNWSIFSVASLPTASIIAVLLMCKLAKDQAVMERDPGENSAAFFQTSFERAFMRSSFRVPHCAMAQAMCERLWAEKVSIFATHSEAIVETSCSFQRPHLAKAQAVLESCRWSKPLILFTTSAAMIDIIDIIVSLRMLSEARPQTILAMSLGTSCSARCLAMSPTRLRTSMAAVSLIWSLPKVNAMSARSFLLTLCSWPGGACA
mmetsp:Transcript_48204/g.127315  ORF Transcript_48204/g.127315 Transcript_48204/m.127315 type:complete len:326 (+) Transcript_48204:636-1613(+)